MGLTWTESVSQEQWHFLKLACRGQQQLLLTRKQPVFVHAHPSSQRGAGVLPQGLGSLLCALKIFYCFLEQPSDVMAGWHVGHQHKTWTQTWTLPPETVLSDLISTMLNFYFFQNHKRNWVDFESLVGQRCPRLVSPQHGGQCEACTAAPMLPKQLCLASLSTAQSQQSLLW